MPVFFLPGVLLIFVRAAGRALGRDLAAMSRCIKHGNPARRALTEMYEVVSARPSARENYLASQAELVRLVSKISSSAFLSPHFRLSISISDELFDVMRIYNVVSTWGVTAFKN